MPRFFDGFDLDPDPGLVADSRGCVEPFADDCQRYADFERQRGPGVSEIVKTEFDHHGAGRSVETWLDEVGIWPIRCIAHLDVQVSAHGRSSA